MAVISPVRINETICLRTHTGEMGATGQGPEQHGAELRATHAERQPLPGFLPASFNKDSLTRELILLLLLLY